MNKLFTRLSPNNFKYNNINLRSLSMVSNCNSSSIQEIKEKHKKRKMKIALVIQYVGSDYYGLQIVPEKENHDKIYNTIELELATSLIKVGAIKESNGLILKKSSWCRSSRTDKKVHAAKMVISAKLELEHDLLNNENKSPKFVELINKFLPQDIRVLSALKVNKSFSAKESCSWREYEYLLPVSVLTGDLPQSLIVNNNNNNNKEWSSKPKDTDEAINRLNGILCRYEGSQSFHNFHRLDKIKITNPNKYRQGKDYKEIKNEFITIKENDNDNNNNNNSINVDENNGNNNNNNNVENEEVNNDLIINDNDNNNDNLINKFEDDQFNTKSEYLSLNKSDKYFSNWKETPREIAPKTRCVIYNCEAIGSINNGELIRIRIRGQSFLLHQIRLLVGCAVLIARGILPDYVLTIALLAPTYIHLPLAPSEGLVLMNAGFNRNSNGKSISITEDSSYDKNEINSLLTKEEENVSQFFLYNNMYDRIINNWYENDNLVINNWLQVCDRYTIDQSLSNTWLNLSNNLINEKISSDFIKDEKESSRILKEIKNFHISLNNNNNLIYENKKFLPNALSTALIIKSKSIPNIEIYDTLRAIATAIAFKKIPHNLNLNQLVELIEKDGGISYWKNQNKHDLIK
jgi:tRNA pseudouridine(38-40) synthase